MTAEPLSGQAIAQLVTAFSRAFNVFQLQLLVLEVLGDRLFVEYASPDWPLKRILLALIEAAHDSGTLELLCQAAIARRPQNHAFREQVAALVKLPSPAPPSDTALSAQRAGVPLPDSPPTADAPGFQRNVRPHLQRVDVGVWRDRLGHAERCVCRIEIDGNAAGTGFLVGPDLVLTNFHVVERALATPRLDRVRCRFGYETLPDGSRQAGQLIALAAADACLVSGPYSLAERANNPDGPAPGPGELDFALLRLAQPAARGWIELPAAAAIPEPGCPLLILQHPDGGPMKLAMDTDSVIGPAGEGRRLRYRTNTDPGSSGSPCFTMDWDLIALHHLGDPSWKTASYNQGIPISLIRQRILELRPGVLPAGTVA